MENSKIILINKKSGISSFKLIRNIQREFKFNKIGHAGTLDPMAEGLMIAMSNKATKLSNLLMKKNKVYYVEMSLGYETNTLDSEGEIIAREDFSHVNLRNIKEVLESFIGKSLQTPPMFSAIKVNGEKLYNLARKNIEIDIKQREIFIEYIKDIEFIDNNKIRFRVKVSSGTYIRSLIRDIAYKLNTRATMTYLYRESIDKFSLPKNEEIMFIDIEKGIELEKIYVNDKAAEMLINGMTCIIMNNFVGHSLHCYNNNKYLGIVNIEGNKVKRSSFFVNKEDKNEKD